jgi:D-3-phosphoglycerate dehydrogenase
VEITYDGGVSKMNIKAMTAAAIAGLIKSQVSDVNMVSAPIMAKERGIQISETVQDKSGVFDSYIKIRIVTEKQERSVAGTVFSDGKPRFIQIKGIKLDAEIGRYMIYTTNDDVPGIIGTLGTVFGEAGVNIANFQLGRNRAGGDAIALLYIDQPADQAVLKRLLDSGLFKQARPLEFDI